MQIKIEVLGAGDLLPRGEWDPKGACFRASGTFSCGTFLTGKLHPSRTGAVWNLFQAAIVHGVAFTGEDAEAGGLLAHAMDADGLRLTSDRG